MAKKRCDFGPETNCNVGSQGRCFGSGQGAVWCSCTQKKWCVRTTFSFLFLICCVAFLIQVAVLVFRMVWLGVCISKYLKIAMLESYNPK